MRTIKYNEDLFCDKRLNKRMVEIVESLVSKPNVILQQMILKNLTPGNIT